MGSEKWKLNGALYNIVTRNGGLVWQVSVYDWATLEIIQFATPMYDAQKQAYVKWLKDEGAREVVVK